MGNGMDDVQAALIAAAVSGGEIPTEEYVERTAIRYLGVLRNLRREEYQWQLAESQRREEEMEKRRAARQTG